MKEQITLLKGAERVRRRPAVIFGDSGLEGAQQAVLELLTIYLREAQLGHCTRLTVQHKGDELTVFGNDRGIYLGQDTGSDEPWMEIFCNFFAYSAYAPEESGLHLGLLDSCHHRLFGDSVRPDSIYFPGESGYMELYTLQCVCAHLEVSVCRQGIHSRLQFAKGENVGGICHQPTDEQDGTCFRFRLDDTVFTDTRIPEDFFREVLERFALLSPGLCCTYETTQGTSRYCYREGLRSLCPDAPVYFRRIEAVGRERFDRAEYEACVELMVAYTPKAGSCRCFHNFRALFGGTHLEAVPVAQDPDFTVVLASWCPTYMTRWSNGSRRSIENRLLTEMTENAAKELKSFCYQLTKERKEQP